MGDVGDDWNAIKVHRQKMREKYGLPCPECVAKLPKALPSILLPGHTCRIHGYRDRRSKPDDMAGMFGA